MDLFTDNLNLWLLGGGFVSIISILSLVIGPKLFGKKFGFFSIIGVIAIIGTAASLPFLLQLISNPVRTNTQAQTGSVPKLIKTINILPTEFTVIWTTESEGIGAIRYGQSSANFEFAAAELDPSVPKTQHVVRVTDLPPGESYSIQIISGGQIFTEPMIQVTLPAK